MTDLQLDTLIGTGAEGVVAREGFARAVSGGAAGPDLALKLAEACRARGHAAEGLWFLGLAMPRAGLDHEALSTLLADLLAGTADGLGDDRGDVRAAAGLARLVAGLDGLPTERQVFCMRALTQAVADGAPPAAILASRFADDGWARDSETFAAFALAAHLAASGPEAARPFAERLSRLPAPGSWTLLTLAKLAAIDGDLAASEAHCRRAIAEHGENLFVLGSLAAALFCRGAEAEARASARRFADHFPPAAAERAARQREERIAELRDAISSGLTDGGDWNRIGTAAHYTEPHQVLKLWQQHRADCGAAHRYRTISAYTNATMFGRVEALLAERAGLTKVVNYGTLAGVWEDDLAGRRPEATFRGFDISELATALNNEAFRRDNLGFGSDLDTTLGDLAAIPGETLLVHCRTADVMLPAALKAVYRSCHDHGVELVLSAEYSGICLDLDFPDFAATGEETVHWSGILMIHDYDRIFAETGYRVRHSEHVPVPLLASGGGEGFQSGQLIRLVLAERTDG